MTYYATVNPLRPSDPRVLSLSTLSQLLWCHLLFGEFHKATRIPGLARGGPATISEHLGLDYAEVKSALEALETAQAIEMDRRALLVRLPGVVREDYRIPASSPNHSRGWLRSAMELPTCEVLGRHLAEIVEVCDASSASEMAALAQRCGVEVVVPATQQVDTLGEALQALREERIALGCEDVEPKKTASLRAAFRALVDERGPEAAARLPVMVRRAAQRVRDDLKNKRDYRHLFTLTHVIKTWDQYESSAHLDDRQQQLPVVSAPLGVLPAPKSDWSKQ